MLPLDYFFFLSQCMHLWHFLSWYICHRPPSILRLFFSIEFCLCLETRDGNGVRENRKCFSSFVKVRESKEEHDISTGPRSTSPEFFFILIP